MSTVPGNSLHSLALCAFDQWRYLSRIFRICNQRRKLFEPRSPLYLISLGLLVLLGKSSLLNLFS